MFTKSGISGLLVTNSVNIFYLTGFKGHSEVERESLFFISTNKKAILILPRLYQQAGKLVEKYGIDVKVVKERHFLFPEAAVLLPSLRVGIEDDNLRVSEYQILRKSSKAKLKEVAGLVEGVRVIKDSAEMKLVRKAVKITDQAFNKIKKEIKVGMTEKQVARRIDELFLELGADGAAFSTIVANGEGSSIPHYVPTDKKISKGILLIDAGAKYKGYNGDLTRTFYVGKPDRKFVDKYNFLLEIQKKALGYVLAKEKEEDPWRKTNDLLGGESKYFIHGLGHGIGLEVHESPYLRKGKVDILKEGMLITVEPGIYYSNWGGIRIEDYVLVTKSGLEVISKAPKDIASVTLR